MSNIIIDTRIKELYVENEISHTLSKKYHKQSTILFSLWILIFAIFVIFSGYIPKTFATIYFWISIVSLVWFIFSSVSPSQKWSSEDTNISYNKNIIELLEFSKKLEWKPDSEKITMIEDKVNKDYWYDEV